MKQILFASLVSIAASGCAPTANPEAAAAADAKLEAVLAGRTAEAPIACVSQRLLRGNKSYGSDTIVFEGHTRNLVYVNRPPGGCPELNGFRALRTRTTTDQLCRGDIVTVFDPTSGVEHGSCGLGDFIAYRRR
ncbi:MAG TPA: hypothetical protein VJR87_07070 [Allosphingosinicella sp.]|nr:hypothetical protein [Allosphingosinicella sp.]